jgi:hypothetical protein
MGFKLSIAGINKLIEKGYVDEAFSEIMSNRIRWDQWSNGFIAVYLVNQLGKENIRKIYDAINLGYSLFDKRFLSKRRLKALEDAYQTYCK